LPPLNFLFYVAGWWRGLGCATSLQRKKLCEAPQALRSQGNIRKISKSTVMSFSSLKFKKPLFYV
jgi:hypothetical protein